MQGPRDTYSRLLKRTKDCLVPEEALPVPPPGHYIAILYFDSIPISSLAINAPHIPKNPLLLWMVILALYLYNPYSLVSSPHWEKLQRKHKVMTLTVSLLTIIPAFFLHPKTLFDYPFWITTCFLAVNAFMSREYQRLAGRLIEVLPILTLAWSATTRVQPSPEFFTCAQRAVEGMCQDMHREGKACSKALHYTRRVAESYLEGIEGQTLFWAILGAVIIDKVPPFLAGMIDKIDIPIIQILLQISLQVLRPLVITCIGTILLMVALHAFLHVHIIHAVEEYKLQHPEEE